MKKTVSFVLFVFLCISAVSSSPSLYIRGAYLFSYDTNVYSDPMVRNADSSWLQWRNENPYIKRFNNGLMLDADVFFSEKGRTGLSFNFANGWAFREKNYKPEMNGSSWNDWDYQEYDVSSTSKMKFFIGTGPVFRAVLNSFDLGAALRASVGSFDFFKDTVIVGLQAELYANVFISKNVFLTFGMLYDAHLMEFYLNNDDKWYNPNYTMLSAGGYVGFGYMFGKRGE